MLIIKARLLCHLGKLTFFLGWLGVSVEGDRLGGLDEEDGFLRVISLSQKTKLE